MNDDKLIKYGNTVKHTIQIIKLSHKATQQSSSLISMNKREKKMKGKSTSKKNKIRTPTEKQRKKGLAQIHKH